MNVFFYINILAGGGAERVVANLANAFAEREHTVSVVTSYHVKNEYITSNKVKRYVLENKKNENSFLGRNLCRIVKLRKLLIEYKPDVLIAFMAEPIFRSLIAACFLKTKVIVSVRNDPKQEYPSKIRRCLANLLFMKADGIVFQTKDAKNCFNTVIRKRSEIIPNQVNDIFYSVSRAKVKKDVITVGRLTKQKNQNLLIEAFDAIKEKIPDNLVIYGEGNERYELEKIVNEKGLRARVFMPGNVANVETYLASAKLFVLSSDYEGMPNALMEAMAVGVPCISTDCPCGGPRAIIENGVNGLLVPVGNKKVLETAMEKVLLDSEYADKLGENAHKSAEAFRSNIIFQQWWNYIKRVENK